MKNWFCIAMALLLCGCGQRVKGDDLSMIQIYDRNGFQETISNEERLARYAKNDYLQTQPYERVVRTFKKNELGQTPGKITSYHMNGQVNQYVETLNGRVNGKYREWHSNGKLRMMAQVIEGRGDFSNEALATWVFDGVAKVFDDQGNLEALIAYDRGDLVDRSLYYYPSGQLKREMPYTANELHGTVVLYRENGERLGVSEYKRGVLEGLTEFYGNSDKPPYKEVYSDGKLLSGNYYNMKGEIISQVSEGNGGRTIYENGQIKRQEEIQKGVVEGRIALYHAGIVQNIFRVKDEKKHGEEWFYYTPMEENFVSLEPKMMITWHDGEMHGPVKSWYLGNRIESHREMAHNERHGIYSSWYGDGSLMFVEEYDMGRLLKGKYYKRNDAVQISEVEEGTGVATFFDYEGYFVQKISYLEGYIIGKASRE